uniref:SH2 domain-containing protein n=1 Tax=Vombatus ursinus TaxID=29139 RepID=A0A4X2JP74_VOMUR
RPSPITTCSQSPLRPVRIRTLQSMSPVLPKILSIREPLRGEPWFHGKLSRREAEGDFLVRECRTTPGQYVLSGLQSGQPKHLLLVDPEVFCINLRGNGYL